MKELQNIIATSKQLKKETAALATLVKVEGSTYRSPGARMLVTSNGKQIGSLSGGCLEGDVIERSQQVMATGKPLLVTYDTTSEDDLIWGLGLGCQGVAHILIEPLNLNEPNALNVIDRCLSQRKFGGVATVFKVKGENEVKLGDRLLLFPDGKMSDNKLAAIVSEDLKSAITQKRSQNISYSLPAGTVEVFLEVIQPPISLTIFGAGFDVLPVVHFARELGWYVTVVDPKMRSQSQQRFAEADVVVLCPPHEVATRLKFDEQSVAVIMTHNYLYDLELLPILLTKSLNYLGILGPKTRTNRLFTDLQTDAFLAKPEWLKNLYSPVGLDIGADNPEEIALSIIAEIRATTQNRQGGFLKNRNGSIHTVTNMPLKNEITNRNYLTLI
ncbi:XdhC family protein [Myxosarcina sp. GI1]|uniref:XdhC family protein n=1 Tax=Myxosarcina sp. GI1 TaxID=1541065 RepID=UPI0005653B02|nr:XdhC/CoxI family protein [Myxosarcina sp. GI1]